MISKNAIVYQHATYINRHSQLFLQASYILTIYL